MCWCVCVCVHACDLFTLVLSLLDVCVLPLVSIEPRLHAEVRLSAPLVQLVPPVCVKFVSRQTVTQYSLEHNDGEWLGHGPTVQEQQSNPNTWAERESTHRPYLFGVLLVVVLLSCLAGYGPARVRMHVAPPLLSPITNSSRTPRAGRPLGAPTQPVNSVNGHVDTQRSPALSLHAGAEVQDWRRG